MSDYFETSPSRTFFKELERWFIDLRGAPLQLSPDDYRVAKDWYEAGIPLDLVRQEIEQVVRRHREAEKDIRRRLRYYRQPVERAFAERRRLQAPAASPESPALDLAGRLDRLAAALPDAPWSLDVKAKIRGLNGDAETIEERLGSLDEETMELAESGLDGAERARLEEEMATALLRLADRLPGGHLASAQERLRRQVLRRFLGLPEMSLFSVDAIARGAEPSVGPADERSTEFED